MITRLGKIGDCDVFLALYTHHSSLLLIEWSHEVFVSYRVDKGEGGVGSKEKYWLGHM